MSLKYFHVFFMLTAALLAVAFGVWCLQNTGFRSYAIPAFVIAVGLPIYGLWFLKKMRNLSNGHTHY